MSLTCCHTEASKLPTDEESYKESVVVDSDAGAHDLAVVVKTALHSRKQGLRAHTCRDAGNPET